MVLETILHNDARLLCSACDSPGEAIVYEVPNPLTKITSSRRRLECPSLRQGSDGIGLRGLPNRTSEVVPLPIAKDENIGSPILARNREFLEARIMKIVKQLLSRSYYLYRAKHLLVRMAFAMRQKVTLVHTAPRPLSPSRGKCVKLV